MAVGEFNQDTRKFSAVYSGGIGAGVSIFDTWLMSGSLGEHHGDIWMRSTRLGFDRPAQSTYATLTLLDLGTRDHRPFLPSPSSPLRSTCISF